MKLFLKYFLMPTNNGHQPRCLVSYNREFATALRTVVGYGNALGAYDARRGDHQSIRVSQHTFHRACFLLVDAPFFGNARVAYAQLCDVARICRNALHEMRQRARHRD